MTLHRNLRGIALAVGFAAVAGLSGTASAGTTWDLPIVWPDGNFHTKNVKMFAEEVKKATNGDVVINVHSGGSLGFKGPEMLKVVRDGLAPIGELLLNQQVGEAPLLGLEATPYLCSGYDDLTKLHKHWVPEVAKVMEKSFNQKLLYVVPWPRQYVYTKVDTKSVAGLKGIKIRTYNKTTTSMFNRIGMTAVQLPWGEVVPSLAAGTIDAVTTSASSGVDGKFWEFLKYTYPTSHVWSSNALSVNLDAWKKLSQKNRDAIVAVAKRLQPKFWDISKAEDDAKLKILTDNGIKLGTVTPAMLKEMQDKTKPMLQEQIKSIGGPAGAIIKAYQKDLGS
ncbi:MAG: TRAP transporter substrate-binding protein [Hyphomicrobiaceae bacterium]